MRSALGCLTSRPAAILGQPLGALTVGAPADVCIFDPEETWRPSSETLVSRGHNTPFLDIEMRGRVRYTLLRGCVVFAAED